jgi:hypothetical protein
VGLRTASASLAFSDSDFARPAGGYSTLPLVQTRLLEPEAQRQFDIERRLTSGADSNRVRGFGLDAEWNPVRAHRFGLRAGTLSPANVRGNRVNAPSGEASYSYFTTAPSFSARRRETPPTVSGISIPGDQRMLSRIGGCRLALPLFLGCAAALGLPLLGVAQTESASASPPPPHITPGEPHTITVVIPTADQPAGSVRYTLSLRPT